MSGTDLYLKNAAIPGFPMLFFSPNGYPESQWLPQAQLTALLPASVLTGKVFGQTKKWSFLTYCIFTSSQLHPTGPRRLLCKVVLPLPQMETVVGRGSCVHGYVNTLPVRSSVKLALLSSEPQKHTDPLRHYLEFCSNLRLSQGMPTRLRRTH